MPRFSFAGNVGRPLNNQRMPMKRLLLAMLLLSPIAYAGEVSILEVTVECPSSCTFSVTLEHTEFAVRSIDSGRREQGEDSCQRLKARL